MRPELICIGDALESLGFKTGWITYGDHTVIWVNGEPENAPTIETLIAERDRLRALCS